MVATYDPGDLDSIVRYARRLEGRTVGDAVQSVHGGKVSGASTKGFVGQLYERYFNIPPNSLQSPDFALAGVELKIVPMKGSRYRVKERTFITQINYDKIHEEPWHASHLEHKSDKILLVFYHWRAGVPFASFKTLGVHLWERRPVDELLLRHAHGHVRMKVLAGEAHTISEGDTKGVGAATKGAGGEWVAQPFSATPAKRRAFAFKAAFMQAVWDERAARLEEVGVGDAIDPIEFEDRLVGRLNPYRGMTVEEIAGSLGMRLSEAKSGLAMIVRRMMGAAEGERAIAELEKMGVTLRAVRIDERGRPREDTSFPAIDFLDVGDEIWEGSTLREQASNMLFVVFRQARHEDLEEAVLLGGFSWRPTEEQDAMMEQEWSAFLHHIEAGTMEKRPQASQTEILHIRPHGRDGRDTAPLPTGREWVKSSFWLNKGFVAELIDEHLRR